MRIYSTTEIIVTYSKRMSCLSIQLKYFNVNKIIELDSAIVMRMLLAVIQCGFTPILNHTLICYYACPHKYLSLRGNFGFSVVMWYSSGVSI